MKKYFCVLGLSCVVAFFVLIGGEAKAQECSAPAPVCAAKASVVKIASFEPIGSAVIINDGVLVTNRHMCRLVTSTPSLIITALPIGSKDAIFTTLAFAAQTGAGALHSCALASPPIKTKKATTHDNPSTQKYFFMRTGYLECAAIQAA